MDYSGRTVLVTGAGGFLGSHLAERLVRTGARVRAMVHYNARGSCGWLDDAPLATEMEVIPGDVRELESLERATRGVDVVFHMAALTTVPYSYQAATSFVRTNVEGGLNALEAARRAGVGRFVQASSSQCYGTARQVPITEDHPLQGQSPYAATKIAADKLAESYHRAFGLPVVTVRVFCTYGPRQSVRNVVPTIITQLLHGEVVRLGNVHPTRDFNYVSDTVEAYMRAGLAPGVDGEVFNVAGHTEISIRDLALRVGHLMGKEVEIRSESLRQRPAASEVERLLGDSSKAARALGWSQQVELDAGLRASIAWYAENEGRVQPGVLGGRPFV